MKFTSEDFMQCLGIEVGDKVKIESLEPYKDGTYTKKYEVYDVVYDDFFGFILSSKNDKFPITNIIGHNFDIIPKPKKVGELTCEECSCAYCPMKMICMNEIPLETSNTLYDVLDNLLDDSISDFFDQEIYDLLKDRLDKEVVEE